MCLTSTLAGALRIMTARKSTSREGLKKDTSATMGNIVEPNATPPTQLFDYLSQDFRADLPPRHPRSIAVAAHTYAGSDWWQARSKRKCVVALSSGKGMHVQEAASGGPLWYEDSRHRVGWMLFQQAKEAGPPKLVRAPGSSKPTLITTRYYLGQSAMCKELSPDDIPSPCEALAEPPRPAPNDCTPRCEDLDAPFRWCHRLRRFLLCLFVLIIALLLGPMVSCGNKTGSEPSR